MNCKCAAATWLAIKGGRDAVSVHLPVISLSSSSFRSCCGCWLDMWFCKCGGRTRRGVEEKTRTDLLVGERAFVCRRSKKVVKEAAVVALTRRSDGGAVYVDSAATTSNCGSSRTCTAVCCTRRWWRIDGWECRITGWRSRTGNRLAIGTW